eukprot:9995990-Alexandrium_andersonii.AAC.1
MKHLDEGHFRRLSAPSGVFAVSPALSSLLGFLEKAPRTAWSGTLAGRRRSDGLLLVVWRRPTSRGR